MRVPPNISTDSGQLVEAPSVIPITGSYTPAVSEDVSPEKAARRTRRRPAEVRQLLLEAAVDVFSSRGHAGASTKVIADTAGVSESALFGHFSSKDKLFAGAVSEPFERFMQEFVAAWELERAARWDDEAFFHEFVTDLYSNLA